MSNSKFVVTIMFEFPIPFLVLYDIYNWDVIYQIIKEYLDSTQNASQNSKLIEKRSLNITSFKISMEDKVVTTIKTKSNL